MVRTKCVAKGTSSMVFLKNQGAYTESISISPELMQICNINYVSLDSDSGLRCRCIETYVIEVHDTCAAGNRAKTKSNRIYIGEIHALVGKGL